MDTRLALAIALASTALIACSGGSDKTPVGSVVTDDQPPLSDETPIGSKPGDASADQSDVPNADEQPAPPATDVETDIGTEISLSPYGANSPLQGSTLDLDTFPISGIVSGGVPKDGIPALTNPAFVGPDEISFMAEDDLVLGLVVGGIARAYPENIGWWHEIVNDEIGGHSISVTFCPLTGTGLVFEAADGGQLELGVSGRLFNNNLVMYDRRDGETLYPQIYFTGVSGSRMGESLTLLPVVETTWRTWKRLHPDTDVVEGVFDESRYTRYPYRNYRTDDDHLIFPLNPRIVENLNPYADDYGRKDSMLGVRLNGDPRAYLFEKMGQQAVINDQLGGVDILVVWDQHSHLALPYAREVDGQSLTFAIEDDGGFPFSLVDEQTGSVWDIHGRAIEGPMAGARLTQVPAHNSFWFAWVTFWQDTDMWTP